MRFDKFRLLLCRANIDFLHHQGVAAKFWDDVYQNVDMATSMPEKGPKIILFFDEISALLGKILFVCYTQSIAYLSLRYS